MVTLKPEKCAVPPRVDRLDQGVALQAKFLLLRCHLVLCFVRLLEVGNHFFASGHLLRNSL